MAISIVSILAAKSCRARDITIKHLTRKLEKLDDCIASDKANTHHYVQRERVLMQLIEAKTYLC